MSKLNQNQSSGNDQASLPKSMPSDSKKYSQPQFSDQFNQQQIIEQFDKLNLNSVSNPQSEDILKGTKDDAFTLKDPSLNFFPKDAEHLRSEMKKLSTKPNFGNYPQLSLQQNNQRNFIRNQTTKRNTNPKFEYIDSKNSFFNSSNKSDELMFSSLNFAMKPNLSQHEMQGSDFMRSGSPRNSNTPNYMDVNFFINQNSPLEVNSPFMGSGADQSNSNDFLGQYEGMKFELENNYSMGKNNFYSKETFFKNNSNPQSQSKTNSNKNTMDLKQPLKLDSLEEDGEFDADNENEDEFDGEEDEKEDEGNPEGVLSNQGISELYLNKMPNEGEGEKEDILNEDYPNNFFGGQPNLFSQNQMNQNVPSGSEKQSPDSTKNKGQNKKASKNSSKIQEQLNQIQQLQQIQQMNALAMNNLNMNQMNMNQMNLNQMNNFNNPNTNLLNALGGMNQMANLNLMNGMNLNGINGLNLNGINNMNMNNLNGINAMNNLNGFNNMNMNMLGMQTNQNFNNPGMFQNFSNDNIGQTKSTNALANNFSKMGIKPENYIFEKFGKRGWQCEKCNNFNFESRIKCNRCKAPMAPKIITKNKSDNPEDKKKKPLIERKGDWSCPKCRNLNFAFRLICNRCQLPKTDSKVTSNSGVTQMGNQMNQSLQKQPMMINQNKMNKGGQMFNIQPDFQGFNQNSNLGMFPGNFNMPQQQNNPQLMNSNNQMLLNQMQQQSMLNPQFMNQIHN
ncbi:MAG: hypothetical protein MJ252_23925 [archaeon]|nr:hypothetical protein [archaeon]